MEHGQHARALQLVPVPEEVIRRRVEETAPEPARSSRPGVRQAAGSSRARRTHFALRDTAAGADGARCATAVAPRGPHGARPFPLRREATQSTLCSERRALDVRLLLNRQLSKRELCSGR